MGVASAAGESRSSGASARHGRPWGGGYELGMASDGSTIVAAAPRLFMDADTRWVERGKGREGVWWGIGSGRRGGPRHRIWGGPAAAEAPPAPLPTPSNLDEATDVVNGEAGRAGGATTRRPDLEEGRRGTTWMPPAWTTAAR
jgi:hypothetical protein